MSNFDSLTTRTPNGLTNASQYQTMGNSGQLDPTWAQTYANDFNTYAADDWTITGSTPGTPALTPGDGGLLLVSNTAGLTDATYLQLANPGFSLVPGKQTFFKFAGTLSDALNSDFTCGLTAKNADPMAAANGIGFRKAVATQRVGFRIVVGGVAANFDLPETCVLADGVPFELGFAIDYQGNVALFFNPGTGSKPQNVPNVPVGRVRGLLNPGLPLPAAFLTPSFGLLNGGAAARSLTVDYVVASRER